jgi:hypothetical protein
MNQEQGLENHAVRITIAEKPAAGPPVFFSMPDRSPR